MCVKSDAGSKAPLELLAAYLNERGMRRTQEREAILSVALAMKDGFDVKALHSSLEAAGYHVSAATVYGAVKLFVDAQLIHGMASRDGVAYYRPCAVQVPPLELVCRVCGARRSVRSAYLSRAVLGHRFASFKPESFTLVVDGLCRKCQSGVARQERVAAGSGNVRKK